jgi:hypothetical protein
MKAKSLKIARTRKRISTGVLILKMLSFRLSGVTTKKDKSNMIKEFFGALSN